MSIITIEDLPKYLTRPGRIAGIDLGPKTIGLASSDLSLNLANAKFTIRRSKFSQDIPKLLQFFVQEEILAIIIGLPLNMNGTEGPRSQATKAFVHNMQNFTDIPFIYQDERLSTVATERMLIEQNMSRKQRSQRIDCAAAAFILQAALDRLNYLRS